ncbi:hypothetical protein EVAR_98963_1 [Eumeta japonica]|uniref:Uncharacterized protein n=1 Tax=Eumeta variegata TaxID=151549 RepID=A0A4C1YQS3_EUMVA|nr:hypothetical protein EVAR_98963_1 [Eumeta japonica]
MRSSERAAWVGANPLFVLTSPTNGSRHEVAHAHREDSGGDGDTATRELTYLSGNDLDSKLQLMRNSTSFSALAPAPIIIRARHRDRRADWRARDSPDA